MMNYLVIALKRVCIGDVFGPGELDEEGLEADPDELHHQEVSKVTPCADSRAVFAAIRAAGIDDGDWSVWKVTPDGIVSQAVTFKHDGQVPYDVVFA